MILYTIEEIKTYLKTQENIEDALTNLSEIIMLKSNKTSPFNIHDFVRNDSNLEKYEDFIGMTSLKEEQERLFRHSSGEKGRYWMALSPRWSNNDIDDISETCYHIRYWVNYGDNETYGLFTVEQIHEWFKDSSKKLCDIGVTKES